MNRLLPLIRKRFGVSTEPDLRRDCSSKRKRDLRREKNDNFFYLVYHTVCDISPRPLTFNAHYGLFRVLLTMFGVLSLASLAGFTWALCCRPAARLPLALWSTVFVAATFMAYFRCQKRGEDFAQSVYDLFVATGGSKTPSSE